MFNDLDGDKEINACNQMYERYLNPEDINLMEGYSIEVFAQQLEEPNNILFINEGDMIVTESGILNGNPRVMQLINNEFVTIAENFRVPITGINYLNGILFISHRGFVTRMSREGIRQNIITGLPSNGDHFNSRVVFGSDNKLYFGQGTATNSGVVGQDNGWVPTDPLTCDYPGDYILLNGQNFNTYDITNEFAPGEIVTTGAFSPYGIPNFTYELRKGYLKASGSILRANLDGTDLEQYAWGFRNPAYLQFDENNRLFVANQGYDNQGSRPITNAPDELFNVLPGLWYGWPDYAGGEPINLPKFTPEGGNQPEFLIKNHPNDPPTPYTTFPMNSNIIGFDFNYNSNFGPYGDAYIAEYGADEPISGADISFYGAGHRVSRIDMKTGTTSTFAINKSGLPSSITREGGFERLVDLTFGPDGAMYVLDLGMNDRNNPSEVIPNTGVIWRIFRTES